MISFFLGSVLLLKLNLIVRCCEQITLRFGEGHQGPVCAYVLGTNLHYPKRRHIQHGLPKTSIRLQTDCCFEYLRYRSH